MATMRGNRTNKIGNMGTCMNSNPIGEWVNQDQNVDARDP